MNDLFVISKNNYNLRNFQELESSLRRTVKFGTETISYRGPQIWNLVPKRLKTLETLNKLKKRNRNGIVMLVHVECAKRTFNVLALSAKSCNVFSLGHRYSNTSCFSIFIDRNLSLRIYTADIISL